MKERIVEFEQVLLRTINFQVDPPDPYRLLLNYARSLRLSRDVTRTAWSIVNDSLFCPRALSTSQPAVACAAIRLAANVHGWDRRLRWFSPAIKRRKRETEDGRGGRDGGGREWKQGTLNQTTVGVGGALPVADTGAAGIISLGQGSMTDYRDAAAGADGSTSKLLPSLTANAKRDDGESCVLAARASKAPENAGRERDGGASRSGEEGDTMTTPWWGLFDARDEEVELVCSELLALYRAHGGQDVGRGATSAHTAGEMAVGTRLNGPRDGATGARGLESSTESLGASPRTAR